MASCAEGGRGSFVRHKYEIVSIKIGSALHGSDAGSLSAAGPALLWPGAALRERSDGDGKVGEFYRNFAAVRRRALTKRPTVGSTGIHAQA